MAFIGVRLSDQLAARFEAVAAVRGGKSRLLRALMEGALSPAPEAPGVAEPARGRSTKITVRLRPEELAALDDAALKAGMRRTEWLASLARRRLSGRPQFNRNDAEALLEARRELRRISVLLRELVETAREEGRAEVGVEALRLEVRGQLERVRKAIEGNLAYWDDAQ